MLLSNLNYVIKKIKKGKLCTYPFPHILIKNFLPKKLFNEFVKAFPSYYELEGNNIFIQSKSGTKRGIFYESRLFKKIYSNNKNFRNVIKIFKEIENEINNKFKEKIAENVDEKYSYSKTAFSCSLSSSIKGYLKSPHIDRREHKFHFLYYSEVQKKSGGEVCLWHSKQNKIYDVFPSKKNIEKAKKILPIPNSCLITLNTPFAYHSVKEYTGSKERKYFYAVYDFPAQTNNYKLQERKKGNNDNRFWINQVKVFSKKRKLNFINE
jgi:hypothetical protein